MVSQAFPLYSLLSEGVTCSKQNLVETVSAGDWKNAIHVQQWLGPVSVMAA